MERENDLKAVGVAPVIIAFSEPKYVQIWIEQTKCTFPGEFYRMILCTVLEI